MTHRIAVFISPHGYGHAARTSAVLQALHDKDRSLEFRVFSLVPEWFFRQSLTFDFEYRPELTDIGLVQRDPLNEDIPATVQKLSDFLPLIEERSGLLADELSGQEFSLLICDVSPLGLRTAAKAGIPSVLIENFTWDWIYEGYEGQEDLQPFSRALAEIFSRAPYRIQTEPVCQTLPGATKVSPVSRYARSSRQEVRTKLGVRPDERIVLVTTGGMYGTLRFLDRLKQRSDLLFLIPSQEQQRRTDANIHYLPGHSDIYHPDLVNAVDLVVGKLGYSTVAEAFRFGRPMIATRRASFRESPVLEEFVSSRLPSLIIDEQDFQSGAWIPEIDHLFDRPVAKGGGDDGAESAARIILEIISGNQASRL